MVPDLLPYQQAAPKLGTE